MSIKGSSYARFKRALDDALGVLALIAAQDPPRYPRAAARWAGRLALEQADLTLAELRVAVGALEGLPESPELERVLRGLVER